MRRANRRWMILWSGAAMLGGWLCGSVPANAAADVAVAGDIVAGTWQRHQVTFSYYGVTSLYTCSGLEDQVRQILLHIGARKDLNVTASGCPGPFGTPSHTAWVKADFYTLAQSPDAGGADSVKARWTPLEVTPRRPGFMGQGDCELIQGMKNLITQNFSLRDVEYRTSCFPHDLATDGFAVKGQALRVLPPPSGAAIGKPN